MRHSRFSNSIRITLSICFILAASAPAAAESLQTLAERAVREGRVGKATFGMLITDLTTGRDLVKIDAETPLIPASNLKLLTTAAALKTLGKEHVFSTQLRLDGHTLIVRGTGDPGFMDPVILEEMGLTVDHVLEQWVEAVKRTGLQNFDAIVVDDRVFDQEFTHPNWPGNQLHHWYCAQVAGINFNTNCLDFYASPTTPGKPPRVRLVPEGVPVSLDNNATTGSSKPLGLARHLGGNRLVVTGQIHHPLTNPSYVTIHDPPLSFGGLLRNRLARAGIDVPDVRRAGTEGAMAEGRLLASVETTLPVVLVRTNRDSQNLFAETLLKYLGHAATRRPGSWETGRAAVSDFLKQALGPAADSIVLDDGSGLSRHNRVSARVLVKVMELMLEDPELYCIYRDSLAQPGQRGTLRRRFVNGELEGRIYAKSGYINGTITLSGYLETGGHTIAFSMLLNNFSGSGLDAKRLMERILIAVDRQYATTTAEARAGGGLGG